MVRLGMITNKIDYKVYSNKPFAIWANSRIINERLSANSYNQDYLDFAKAKNTFNFKKVSDIARVTAMIGWKGLTTDDYVDEDGVYLLRTVDIKDNYIDLENAVMAKREKVYEQPQIILKQGDIIFSKDGTLGITAIVPRHQNKEMCVGSTLARIRLNSNLDNYYVCAAFMSKIVQAQIGYFTSGIAQPHITQEYINKLEIPIPSPEIQKYIGDKVRKAEELREEAKRLKKEAEEILNNELNVKELLIKIDRYTEKHSWIMNSDINDRMDALYYNPQKITIKKFYKNYNLQKLKDLVDYKKGYAFKSEDYCNNTSTFLLRVSDISNNEVDMCNMLNLPDEFYQEYKDFNLINGDIVMVVTGNTTGKSIVINNNKFKLLLNQNAIRMRIKEGIDISPYYIELILQSQYFQTLLKYSLYQSVQPFISMEFLNDVVIPIIDKTKIENISNLYEKSLNNLFYAKQLIQEAKQDVEDLIEGNFDMSKVKANS